MNIKLTGHSEELVHEKLAQGGFRTAEEVIEHALELLHSEEELFRDQIEEGWRQAERGELLTPEQARQEMEKRKATWLANRNRRR